MPTMTPHRTDCECVRCCDADAVRDNPIHASERQEALSALRGPQWNECYGHHNWVPDGTGGAQCSECPAKVSREEL